MCIFIRLLCYSILFTKFTASLVGKIFPIPKVRSRSGHCWPNYHFAPRGRGATVVKLGVEISSPVRSEENVDDFFCASPFFTSPFFWVVLLLVRRDSFTAILRAFNFSTLNKQAIKLSSNGCLNCDLLVLGSSGVARRAALIRGMCDIFQVC